MSKILSGELGSSCPAELFAPLACAGAFRKQQSVQ